MKKKILLSFLILSFSGFNFAQLADHLVIAEIYGGGGNSGSHWQYDYIILYNPTSNSVDVSDWSVQYAAANGTSWDVTNLLGTISSNSYYAIQEAQGSVGSDPLPFTPNVVGSIAMSATDGKVALVSNQSELTGSDPTGSADVIDFVGYGSPNAYEGSNPAPTLSNTSSARRKDNSGNATYGTNGSGWDSDDNSSDFYKETDLVNNAPLPIELSSFTASIINNNVKLNWRTETEVNNYGFDVERSSSTFGTRWDVIGFVYGTGNTNSPREYFFIDQNVLAGKYLYRLEQIDNDGTFTYSKVLEININTPLRYELMQNYPNPFNSSTKIKYSVPDAGLVKISLLNVLGEEVKIIFNGNSGAGTHTLNFDSEDLNSGVYFYKIEVDSFVEVKKMCVLK